MLDKKMIKAIRLVLGLTDDLRVEIKHYDKNAMFSFIDTNRYGIFGMDHELANKPTYEDDNWDEWERKMWQVVNEVLGV